jgi:hypothetical protein
VGVEKGSLGSGGWWHEDRGAEEFLARRGN